MVNNCDFDIYYFIVQKYYFNEQNRKIKFENVIKQYCINDKVGFEMIKQNCLKILDANALI